VIKNFESGASIGRASPEGARLVPIFHGLRDLGKALIPAEYASAAGDRILYYFRSIRARSSTATSCSSSRNSGVCTAACESCACSLGGRL